jgi:hypothetical protein
MDKQSRLEYYRRKLIEMRGFGPGASVNFMMSDETRGRNISFHNRPDIEAFSVLLYKPRLSPGEFARLSESYRRVEWGDNYGFRVLCTLETGALVAEEFFIETCGMPENSDVHSRSDPGIDECDLCGIPLTEEGHFEMMYVDEARKLGVRAPVMERLIETAIKERKQIEDFLDDEPVVDPEQTRKHGLVTVLLCNVCAEKSKRILGLDISDWDVEV